MVAATTVGVAGATGAVASLVTMLLEVEEEEEEKGGGMEVEGVGGGMEVRVETGEGLETGSEEEEEALAMIPEGLEVAALEEVEVEAVGLGTTREGLETTLGGDSEAAMGSVAGVAEDLVAATTASAAVAVGTAMAVGSDSTEGLAEALGIVEEEEKDSVGAAQEVAVACLTTAHRFQTVAAAAAGPGQASEGAMPAEVALVVQGMLEDSEATVVLEAEQTRRGASEEIRREALEGIPPVGLAVASGGAEMVGVLPVASTMASEAGLVAASAAEVRKISVECYAVLRDAPYCC